MAALVRRISLQININQQGAKEEVTANLPVQQHGVLADPAQPRAAGEVTFQQRGGIDDGAPVAAGLLFLKPGQQQSEAFPEDVMIINRALSVASNLCRRA